MKPKHLLLVRHVESVKNIQVSFSSTDDSEPLTKNGLAQGELLSEGISKFVSERNLIVNTLYTASSGRAVSTAKMIADKLGIKILDFESLRSPKFAFAGMSETEIAKVYPTFYSQLTLYRYGLFNSYNLDRPHGSENLLDFEKRIKKSILGVINIPNETLKVVILHRAAITATLIYFARKYYGYPKNFYGYVSLDLGGVSWIRQTENSTWEIMSVNQTIDEFC